MSDRKRSDRADVCHYRPFRSDCSVVYRPALAEAQLSYFEGISNCQTFRPQRPWKRIRNRSEIRAWLDERFDGLGPTKLGARAVPGSQQRLLPRARLSCLCRTCLQTSCEPGRLALRRSCRCLELVLPYTTRTDL